MTLSKAYWIFLGWGISDEPYFRRHQVKSSKSLSEQEGTFTIRSDCQIVAGDLGREMLKAARERAAKLNIDVQFFLADAQALPFRDHGFDTVVSSLSTCTFSNPANALQEMARVSKPSGQILLVEHGRSDRGWLGRWQDRHADDFAKPFGCHWNREPVELPESAGLKSEAQRSFFAEYFTGSKPHSHAITVLLLF